jgi:hypothetical protein
MIKISGITDDTDRIATVTERLSEVDNEQANALENIFHQLGLDEDSRIVIIDENLDSDEFLQIAETVDLFDRSSDFILEDEDEIAKLGWEKIDSKDACTFIKDNVAYNYTTSSIPSFFILVVEV